MLPDRAPVQGAMFPKSDLFNKADNTMKNAASVKTATAFKLSSIIPGGC
jgi:hypothetical protein